MQRKFSQYKTVNGVEMKSCPSCDKFLPVEEFGERQDKPGHFIVQSWCPECRHTERAAARA